MVKRQLFQIDCIGFYSLTGNPIQMNNHLLMVKKFFPSLCIRIDYHIEGTLLRIFHIPERMRSLNPVRIHIGIIDLLCTKLTAE